MSNISYRFIVLMAVISLLILRVGEAADQSKGVKPGLCPSWNPLWGIGPACPPRPSAATLADNCDNDSQCDGKQKCCKPSCTGLRCEDPLPDTSPATNPCVCPYISSRDCSGGPIRCNSSIDCRNGKKCCSTRCGGSGCTNPAPLSSAKIGTCPYVAIVSTSDCKKSCNKDTSCPHTKKCCSNSCSAGRECKCPAYSDEFVLKDGGCPILFECPMMTPGEIFIDQCEQDGQCKGKEKCCPICGSKKCVTP